MVVVVPRHRGRLTVDPTRPLAHQGSAPLQSDRL